MTRKETNGIVHIVASDATKKLQRTLTNEQQCSPENSERGEAFASPGFQRKRTGPAGAGPT
ncbi:MAG: hypothetical protein K2P13_10695, partial [Lachnospiraceae bacterium]|nr:hypothetical protein [Lachnospiraceae bacterium]